MTVIPEKSNFGSLDFDEPELILTIENREVGLKSAHDVWFHE